MESAIAEKNENSVRRSKFESIDIKKNNAIPIKINEFCEKIVNEINYARTDFLGYSQKIQNFSEKIITEKESGKKYFSRDTGKVYLPKKEDGFQKCLNYFKKKYEKCLKENSFPKKLRFVEELKFPFPKKDNEKCLDSDYIKDTYSKLKKIFEGTYDFDNLIYYKSSDDPEISTLLQIVDQEHQGKVRDVLLNRSLKYIGVKNEKLKDGSNVVFIFLAN